jgi:hypothetical protein
MSTPLKLRAVDEADLEVLGACLQDTLIPVHDMCFLAEEQRFVLVANRFRWENLEDSGASGDGEPAEETADQADGRYQRVHCGITFEHVTRVQCKGFTPGAEGEKGRLLEVLTILPDDGELTLIFAGGAAVRLEIEEIDAFLQDVGEPWPTLWRPRHPIDAALDRDGGTR